MAVWPDLAIFKDLIYNLFKKIFGYFLDYFEKLLLFK